MLGGVECFFKKLTSQQTFHAMQANPHKLKKIEANDARKSTSLILQFILRIRKRRNEQHHLISREL
jgi:hypothetical protein